MPPLASAYPAEREADVVLRDGSTVRIRPVRREDEPRLLELLLSLSSQARALRFFAGVGEASLRSEARDEACVDYRRRYGLVAVGDQGRIVGHAMYAAEHGDRAEVAFTVAEDQQGRGLGTLLLGQIAEAAAANGFRTLEAEVLAGNQRMIEVFRDSGFSAEAHVADGEIHAHFEAVPSAAALERFEDHDRAAAAAALRAFLEPASVAVVAASLERGSVGAQLLYNIRSHAFPGRVYAVSDAAGPRAGPAWTTLDAIPGPVDLALLAVPAPQVLQAARACARKKVRCVVVLSAGFGECGEEGRSRQAELLRVCRAAGMRLIGPNGLGLVNTDPALPLFATAAPVNPRAGRIGLLSQSGALGLAIIELASHLGLGISSFVAVGNKADISGNDLLAFWETDPRTGLALLYLESFGNPRRFSRLARRVGRRKPVIALKGGRTRAGAQATTSHTGALLAAADVTVDALFRQAGVIRADTIEELIDVTALLYDQPVPAGRRVAVVSNAGGPAILCVDACEAEGLEVPQLAPGNPLRLLQDASPDAYGRAVESSGGDPAVDAVIALFAPAPAAKWEPILRAVAEAADRIAPHKPVLCVAMPLPSPLPGPSFPRVPVYGFPEAAARALARAARYGEWRSRPAIPAPRPAGLRHAAAQGLVANALGSGSGWLADRELRALLACYGLALAAGHAAGDGFEMSVGVVHDPLFGPVVACGAGPERLLDVGVRLTPFGLGDAAELVCGLKSYPLLSGEGRGPARDVKAVEDLLLRVAALVEDIPEVAELDLNPLFVHASGVTIAAARLRLEVQAPPRPLGARS